MCSGAPGRKGHMSLEYGSPKYSSNPCRVGRNCWGAAQVPLSEDGRRIANLLEHFRNRNFPRVDPDFHRGAESTVDADAVRIGSRQEGGPRGRAGRLRNVEIGESHALPGHPVEVGSLETSGPVDAHITIPLVIRENDDDIGRRFYRGLIARGTSQHQQK